VGLAVYSVVAGAMLTRDGRGAIFSTAVSGVVWFAVAFALWALVLR
jgi:hypothetical protein